MRNSYRLARDLYPHEHQTSWKKRSTLGSLEGIDSLMGHRCRQPAGEG